MVAKAMRAAAGIGRTSGAITRNEEEDADEERVRHDRQRQDQPFPASDACRRLDDVVKHVFDLRKVRHR